MAVPVDIKLLRERLFCEHRLWHWQFGTAWWEQTLKLAVVLANGATSPHARTVATALAALSRSTGCG